MLSIDKGEKKDHLNSTSELNHHSELVNNYQELSESEEEIDWNIHAKDKVEKITEDHLVSAAINYSHGHLPLVNRALFLTDTNLNSLDHIPFLYRSIVHPLLAFKILYLKLLEFLGQQPFLRNFPIAKSDLQLLLLLFVYCFVSSESNFYVIPVLFYYVSFIVLTVTTCQMLQTKKEFTDFRFWSGLFICYSGGELNSEQAENQYLRNNLRPYGHFFLALLINLIMYPIILEMWLPQSEITILAFCFTFVTLFGFMPIRRSKILPDYLILFSFAINVLAKYPYETDSVVMQGWRFLDLKTTYLPTFASYVIGNGIEFCVNFRALLYSFIPLLFIRIASRDNWRGTYKDLIPHCVTLSWLQIVIINSQGATMYGLLRGTLALVGFVLFIPLAGLTSVLLPAAALTKWLMSSNLIYAASIFAIFTVIGLSISWLLAKSKFCNLTAVIQIVIATFALYFLLVSYKEKLVSHGVYVEPKSLSWTQYEHFCGNSKTQKTAANIQMDCIKLDNVPVQWEGYLTDVKIKSVKNKWKALYNYLPKTIQEHLYCLHGERIVENCSADEANEICMNFYDVIKSNNKCSLDKYNIYEIVLSLKMQTRMWDKPVDVLLEASDCFKNFTFKLKQDDHIWFKGKLINKHDLGVDGYLGGPLIYVQLDEIGCISCTNDKLTDFKCDVKKQNIDITKLMNDVYIGLKSVLNFLLNPLFVFK